MTSYNSPISCLEPEWCVALLVAWSHRDTPNLGLPRVSPMWAAARDAGSEDGGESLEMAALRAALERLRCESPDECAAVLRAFRPWIKYPAHEGRDDSADLQSAVTRLAEWVDEAVGD